MYSSAGTRATSDTLREFEQVRGFFLQALGGQPAKPLPVRLVAFGSAKDFEPYRFNEFAIAYYQPTPERDYIVMSHAGSDTFPVAVHEYVHLLVRHSGLKLPPWLNEGIAELYSTLKPYSGKIEVGDLIAGRYQALLTDKWTSLDTILSADVNSPYYNEKNKAGSLYNEGWALTHMLMLRADYPPKFGDLVTAISGGKDSSQALLDVYGKTVPQIEKDLQGYLRGGTFRARLVPAKIEKATGDLPVEDLGEFDTGLMLSDLSYRRGKEAEHRAALEHLAALDPKRPEPYRGLGYLEWTAGHSDTARQEFAKAYACGDRDSKLLWDYGRMLESVKLDDAVPVLSDLLKQEPDRLDVKLEIAETQLREQKAADALATIATIHKVTAADSARYFRIAVYAHLMNNDHDNAEATAKHFLEAAKTDNDRAAAQQLMSVVNSRATPGPPARKSNAMPSARDSDTPPVIRHTEPAPAPPDEVQPQKAEPPLATVTGDFVELRCLGIGARMILETSHGRKSFLIDDPGNVKITGKGDWQVEMTCGPQKLRARVEVGYNPPGAQSGVDGLVRSISYQ